MHEDARLFKPRLEALPQAQRLLWQELGHTPRSFVLYGGTAIALRLGHRQSDDFDFFSNERFEPGKLLESISYLKDARIDQGGDNTLSVMVKRGGQVKLAFFGDVRMNRIEEPDVAENVGLQIASLIDLTATKLKTIQQRAEAKDYIDLAAGLGAGLNLADGLSAARAVYGPTFSAVTALKALTYFEDGNLPSLPVQVRERLRRAAAGISLEQLPLINAKPGIVGGRGRG
jgi:hypothetical protein